MKKPIVALVGRPNVGKSTLFNRLIGERKAIVEDLPGTTRDRIYGEADWTGHDFIVVDTGGLEPKQAVEARLRRGEEPLALSSAKFLEEMRVQAQIAIDEADVILFLVDATAGITAGDLDVADILRRTSKPVILVANKADNEKRRADAVEFYALGLGEPFPISSNHGTGTGDLLDEVVKGFGEIPEDDDDDSVKIAIVGRPNVGKSSLLNAILGQERAIVSDVPGTTRDAIDTFLTYDGIDITLIDTAGIRRRGSVLPGIEKFSVVRSLRAISRSDVALLLIDAVQGVTDQDAHIAGYILEENKSVVVVVNKWDAIEKDNNTMNEYRARIRKELKFLDFVPVLFISALTHQRVDQVMPTALRVQDQRMLRVPTGELNRLLREAVTQHIPTGRPGQVIKFYYATQAEVDPPTFVIFVNDAKSIHFSYQRFLENRIRAVYPFEGTPIRIVFRQREKSGEDRG